MLGGINNPGRLKVYSMELNILFEMKLQKGSLWTAEWSPDGRLSGLGIHTPSHNNNNDNINNNNNTFLLFTRLLYYIFLEYRSFDSRYPSDTRLYYIILNYLTMHSYIIGCTAFAMIFDSQTKKLLKLYTNKSDVFSIQWNSKVIDYPSIYLSIQITSLRPIRSDYTIYFPFLVTYSILLFWVQTSSRILSYHIIFIRYIISISREIC